MKRRLTRAIIDRTAVPATGRLCIQDETIPALSIDISRSGRKSWLVYYRFRGQRRRPKIGEFPAVPIDAARRAAQAILAEVAAGRDPSAERHEARNAPTVDQLLDRYLADHAVPRKAASSVVNDRSMIRRYLRPKLGKLRVADVNGGDAERTIAAAAARGKVVANRVRALLSKVFALAERWGMRPHGSNPARGIERYPEKRRRRALAPAEVAALATGLDAVEAAGDAYARRCCRLIRLLALTGARHGEIRRARAAEVDRAARALRVPDNKERNPDKTIPLGADAWPLMAEAMLEAGDGGGWLFPSNRRAGIPMDEPRRIWREVKAAGGLPADLHLHDLRHTYASAALLLGYTLDQIGSIIGHSAESTTETYAYLLADPRKDAADRIGAEIGRQLGRQKKALL